MARKKEKKKKRKSPENRKKVIIFGTSIVLLGLIAIVAGVTIYSSIVISKLPPLEEFGDRKVNQSTKIYDRTGETILYEIFGEEKRTLVDFDNIPEKLKQATLAAEDAGFYNQPAFDWKAIIRALVANIREGEIVQGGSTITQQLVKNTFLTSEKTITRKIKEVIIAIELESRYSKEEIFDAYLNQIPYGSNAYGVEAASQTFFNKPVEDLSLSEMVTIASLPQAPSYYSPWGNNVQDLINRRDHVLERMYGLGFINQEELDQALEEDVVSKFAPKSIGSIKAPHFSLMVRDYLVDKYGEETALNGGLRVITTLDWEMQEIAEKVVEEGAERNESLYGGRNASLVAQDPKTGQILTLVGSRDWYNEEIEGQFNVVTQGLRQPGSALKPFAYLEAFNKGFHPKSVVMDVFTEFASGNPRCPAIITPTSRFDSECFNPENFDGIFRGPVSLEQSLSQSINVPSVKTLYLAGFDDVLKTLNDFGIKTLNERWRYGLSLVLGGGEIRPIELVNAYATLADDGVFHEQSIILEIKDNKGNTIEEYYDESERVYNREPVRMINSILSNVELRSGLFQSSLPLTTFGNKEVALKTGTTNDYKDAWAFGYTPSIAVGVWAGNNNNDAMHAQGSSILAAIPMWSNFLNEVFSIKDFENETFNKPEPIELPNKPMLNGDPVFSPEINGEVRPQIHSILYWVNKEDILGDPPSNPNNDPQFNNWEEAVKKWAKENISDFSNFNEPIPSNLDFSETESVEEISISNLRPKNGDFIEAPFVISGTIDSKEELERIEIVFNGERVKRQSIGDNSFDFSYEIDEPIYSQNSIEIKITDKEDNEKNISIIVFGE